MIETDSQRRMREARNRIIDSRAGEHTYAERAEAVRPHLARIRAAHFYFTGALDDPQRQAGEAVTTVGRGQRYCSGCGRCIVFVDQDPCSGCIESCEHYLREEARV